MKEDKDYSVAYKNTFAFFQPRSCQGLLPSGRSIPGLERSHGLQAQAEGDGPEPNQLSEDQHAAAGIRRRREPELYELPIRRLHVLCRD